MDIDKEARIAYLLLEKYQRIRKIQVANYKQNTLSGIKVRAKIEVLKELLKELGWNE